MHLWNVVAAGLLTWSGRAEALTVDLTGFGIRPEPRTASLVAAPVDKGLKELFDKAGSPISCSAGMAVDTDGPADGNPIPDPDTHQDVTAATYDDGAGTSISAFRIPYVVKPQGSSPGKKHCAKPLNAVRLWDLVRVKCAGKSVMAVVADLGPVGKFGEGSVALHDACGNTRARENVGIGSGITYIFFPGTGVRARNEAHLKEIILRGADLDESMIGPNRPDRPRAEDRPRSRRRDHRRRRR